MVLPRHPLPSRRPARRFDSLLRSGCAALALSLTACGGAQSAGSQAPETDSDSEVELATDTEETESAQPADHCADGSCFVCGEGVCPSGFYCDEGLADGPACSWLPACAKEPSCACLLRELPQGCSCEERDRGPHVSCP